MQINVTFDQSVSSLPVGFVAAINYVVGLYDSLFTNPVTVNIDVGYGEIAGQALGSTALGESESYLVSPTYAQAVAALRNAATSTLQNTADATLPATAPYSSGNLWMTTAEAKAVGLLSAGSTGLDGYVGFSSTLPFSYSTTGAPASGQYDFVAVAEHEISEVMGRISLLGANINGATSYGLMDLFRYSAPGVRDLTATPPSPYSGAYFSVNGGTTNLDNWNTSAGGDLGDWAASAGNDAYLAFSSAGQLDGLSSADYALMNALGWDLTPPTTVVTSVTASPSSGVLLVGETVNITVGLSAAVATTGTPYLLLNDGGVASYNAAATAASNNPGELIFSYTVGSTDHDVATLAATGINLNGAAIVDEFGAAANLAGVVTSFSGLEVIAAPPVLAITGVVPASNAASVTGTIDAFDAGQTITLFDASSSLSPGSSAWKTSITANAGGSWSAANVPWTEIGGSLGVTATNAAGVGLSDYVFGTAVANGAVLAAGEFQYISGTASGYAIDSGGTQEIYAGGSATGTTLYGTQIDWGASTNAELVGSGVEYVLGTAIGSTVASGVQSVLVGGAASGTTIDAGGQQIVYSSAAGAGSASGTMIDGGSQTVYGATVNKTTINSGGLQYLFGTATSTTINSSGEQNVYADGSATGTTVNTGGTEIVWGTDSSATIAGGTQFVVGTATGATITSGTQSVLVGGAATGTTIDAGGQQIVYSSTAGAGSASGTMIDGGSQTVYGATVNKTTINNGGLQYLFGTATNTTIDAGGEQNVYASAAAAGTTVNTGGTEIVWGTDSNAAIAGGTQFVVGTASGATITGGTQYVLAGGAADGTVIDGGTEHLFTGGTANGVTFGGASGTLVLDRASTLGGAITGFQPGDTIDLSFVSFNNAGTTLGYSANTSGPAGGTLTVTDGAHTATLALLGQYAASSFALSSDASGGTFVTDPASAQPQLASAHS